MLVVALPFSSKSWPCTSLLIATDIAFGTIPKIASLALILNLLTKTLIINEGIRQKNYRAIVLNSASTAALLSLPQGWLIAAIIDLFFTVLCSYTHPLSKEKPMTTSVIQQLNPSGENQTALVLRPVPVDLSRITAGALAGTGIGIVSRLSFPQVLSAAFLGALIAEPISKAVEALSLKTREWSTKPMDRQAALARLDLTEEEAKDPDALKSRYDAQMSDLNRRISKASSPIAERLRRIVEECQRAHELLKS